MSHSNVVAIDTLGLAEGLETSEHEDVLVVRRRGSGLRAIIAIHSTALGPSLGGARFYPFARFDLALQDVLRLSRAMTAKAALAGLAQGGGKAVIIGDPAHDKSTALLDDFAAAVDSLGGRYVTAEDVGTTQADMDRLQQTTPFVGGTSPSSGGSGDPSPMTAVGVVCAMEAAAAHRWQSGLAGKTVLVLGAGKVGGDIVRLLVEQGAIVLASDVNPERIAAANRAGAARIIDPSDALHTPADIFCPCAMGGVITERSVVNLPFEIIVGAANNQLASTEVAAALKAADVLYVPDYLANAGGIINIAEEPGGYDLMRARRAVERIRETTTMVLQHAETLGITPVAAAERLVDERLQLARSG